MTLPVDSFAVLAALAGPSRGNAGWYEVLGESVRRFPLVVAIIHDPWRHRSFHDELVGQFNRLNYQTGESVLVFALVDPPDEWDPPPWFRSYVRKRFGSDALTASLTGVPWFTAYHAAASLGIRDFSRPVLVVLSKEGFAPFVMPTAAATIELDILRLVIAANNLANTIRISKTEIEWCEDKCISPSSVTWLPDSREVVASNLAGVAACAGRGVDALPESERRSEWGARLRKRAKRRWQKVEEFLRRKSRDYAGGDDDELLIHEHVRDGVELGLNITATSALVRLDVLASRGPRDPRNRLPRDAEDRGCARPTPKIGREVPTRPVPHARIRIGGQRVHRAFASWCSRHRAPRFLWAGSTERQRAGQNSQEVRRSEPGNSRRAVEGSYTRRE